MKTKNIVRFLILSLFLFFICVYVAQATGYYEFDNRRKTALTESAINRFEQDLKSGKNIEAKNYLEDEKQYTNSFYKLGLTASNTIEKSFNKLMNYIFKEMGEVVDKR